MFDATLNQTKTAENINKFYRLQLLESATGEQFYLHTRWGRVGEAGRKKTKGPGSLPGALTDFKDKFKDKTGLTWEEKRGSLKKPKADKYTFLGIDYTNVDKDEDDDVQRLIDLIVNKNHFNSVRQKSGHDKDRLPLGNLDETTLARGFECLNGLASLLMETARYGTNQEDAIQQLSDDYYSIIPHVFKRHRPPLIDNDHILRKELAMLGTLMDGYGSHRGHRKASDGARKMEEAEV